PMRRAGHCQSSSTLHSLKRCLDSLDVALASYLARVFCDPAPVLECVRECGACVPRPVADDHVPYVTVFAECWFTHCGVPSAFRGGGRRMKFRHWPARRGFACIRGPGLVRVRSRPG